MTFRFSLQAVLRFRASLEHQQELLLQQAHQNAAAVRRKIETLDHRLAENTALTMRELKAGAHAAQLHFEMLCRASLLEYRHKLETELIECEKLCQRRSLDYRLARQQREVLDRLRNQRLEVYRLEEARRQQQRLDELFLWRREFLRRG